MKPFNFVQFQYKAVQVSFNEKEFIYFFEAAVVQIIFSQTKWFRYIILSTSSKS